MLDTRLHRLRAPPELCLEFACPQRATAIGRRAISRVYFRRTRAKKMLALLKNAPENGRAWTPWSERRNGQKRRPEETQPPSNWEEFTDSFAVAQFIEQTTPKGLHRTQAQFRIPGLSDNVFHRRSRTRNPLFGPAAGCSAKEAAGQGAAG